MAPENPAASAGAAEEADLAKAFQKLAEAERTAAAMEAKLSKIEAKIDAFLEEAEREQQQGHQDAEGATMSISSASNTA